MSYREDLNVFVGGTTGAFKGLKVNERTCIAKNIQSLIAITDDQEITTMAWGDQEEKEILIGSGSKGIPSVKIYDTEYSAFTSSFNCDGGKGKIKGISRFNEAHDFIFSAVITAVETGHVKLWRYNESEQISINAGENLQRMRHSIVNKNIIATGGRENPLKLFDLEKQEKVFIEKNVPPDICQLRMPVWVSDLIFLPNTSSVVTASKYGHVRLYDPRSTQRRPLINLEIKDEALTTIAAAHKEKHVVVGSGKGRMNLIDLRNPGKILNTYKGFTGGVTDLACSQLHPLITSVSLDRHLRIHHLETKQLLKEVYLVFSLNAVLLRSNFSLEANSPLLEDNVENTRPISCSTDRSTVTSTATENCVGLHSDYDVEYDEMFNQMPVIDNASDANVTQNKRHYPYKEEATVIDDTLEYDSGGNNKKSRAMKKNRRKSKVR
ncbi:WD repeat-containing protein 74 isoform X1 [Neodiprion virginianus]|uniref:WD repeat-containing protein 74 isoform X1 n=2 Tax=Neodiprion virginianus TaxID=2961670 RepID=UPI001EE7635F|nr:WD repeat-containing protein 74 isoform X1 [Neodiprion virginianus]